MTAKARVHGGVRDAGLTGDDTTLIDLQRKLQRLGVTVESLGQREGEWSLRLLSGSRGRRYYGAGKTIGQAFTSAFDDYVIDMANTYARA